MPLQIMGILNLTTDSFSDGGMYIEPEQALRRTKSMIEEGAQIIDLGAESTRPGAFEVKPELECSRLLPVLQMIRDSYPLLPISVDTRKASVAEAAIACGATIINDVSALRHDPEMLPILAANPQISVVLMHMQGTPQTMQNNPHYSNLQEEILYFFSERIEFCLAAGINRLILDPGIGFGKNLSHNLSLLANLKALRRFGYPVLLGASRKRYINELDPSPTDSRLGGSLAAIAFALQADIELVRVHDVAQSKQFIRIWNKINEEPVWDS